MEQVVYEAFLYSCLFIVQTGNIVYTQKLICHFLLPCNLQKIYNDKLDGDIQCLLYKCTCSDLVQQVMYHSQ